MTSLSESTYPYPDNTLTGKTVLVSCGHCGKQCDTPIKDENNNVLVFITNTNCEYCGKVLAKIEIKYEESC